MSSTESPRVGEVRLTISRSDLINLSAPGELLLDLLEHDDTVLERATAWASVRGYTRIIPSLQRILLEEPSQTGWSALINKPHSLLVLATWPWCPGPHDLAALQDMG